MFGLHFSRLGSVSRLGLVPKALAILRSYGADAHVYIPGVGTVNGITAGNYLDSAGVTAASVDNPIGLSLDALQAMTLGADKVTNGRFDADTNWTKGAGVAISGGVAVVTASSANLYQSLADLSAGDTLEVQFSISGYIAGTLYVNFGGSTPLGPVVSSNGVFTQTIGPLVGTPNGNFVFNFSGFSGNIDAVSVREIPGIHATQATTANKPILRRGLLNQLLWSQDVSNAIWSKSRVGFTTGQIGPDGATANATLVYPNLTGDYPGVFQTITRSSGVDSTTFRVKASGFSWVLLVGADGSGSQRAWFNLTTGVKGSVTGGLASSIAPVANGFYDCTITSPASSNPYAQLAIVDGDGNINGTANGTNGVIVSIAGLFQGTLTAQQIIDAGGIPLTTTAPTSSTTGKSWQFDGSNDSLLTGNLGITNTVTVVIAGRLNSLSAIQVLFYEDIGGFGLYLSAAGAVLFSNVGAGTIVASGAGTLAVGVPFVITVRLQGGTAVIRKDGVQIATGSTALIFSATTGARIGTGFSGTTDPLNGSIYSVDVITATTTDSDLLTLERLAGQMAGVSI